MRILKIFIIPALIPLYSSSAQDITTAEPVKVSGQLSAFAEKYSFSGTGTAAHVPTTGRLQINMNFSFFDALQIPLTGILATDQVSYRQNMNQLAINPKYKWVALHIGTFAPQFSDLTLSDASVLGGGIDLTPENFHFSFVGGRMNKAINTGDANSNYTRNLFGIQAGYGDMEHSFFDVNIVRSVDLASSLPDTLQVTPQEDLVASLRFQIKLLNNRLMISNEVSGSAFTKNTNAPESENSTLGIFKSFLTSRTSSTSDWGMIDRIQYTQDFWSADLKTTYLRPGYSSFGCSQLQADQFEYLLSGKVRLLENKLLLSTSIGQRWNNLENDQENATKRLIFNFNSSYQVTSFFGFDIVYGKNNVNIKNSNDTTTISNINNNISIVPRFIFSTGDLQHLIVTNFTYQNSDNSTNKNIQLLNSKTATGLFNYSLTFPSTLSLNFSTIYTVATIDTIESKILNIIPTVNYSFLEGRLTTSVGLQLGFIKTDSQNSDAEIFPQLSLSYNVAPRNALTFSLTHRAYTYGNTPPGGNFKESIVTLRYTLSF